MRRRQFRKPVALAYDCSSTKPIACTARVNFSSNLAADFPELRVMWASEAKIVVSPERLGGDWIKFTGVLLFGVKSSPDGPGGRPPGRTKPRCRGVRGSAWRKRALMVFLFLGGTAFGFQLSGAGDNNPRSRWSRSPGRFRSKHLTANLSSSGPRIISTPI